MKAKGKRQKAKGKNEAAQKLWFFQLFENADLCLQKHWKNAFCLLPFAFCLLPFALVSAQQPAAKPAGELVDQLAATVNGEVITQSDLVWLLALDPRAVITHVEMAELQRILGVKIDLVLLNQEAQRQPNVSISSDDIKRKEREIIARFPSEMLFRQRIESVGMTSEALARIAQEQVAIEKYTDFRFRSFVIVTEEEINAFYRDVVRPKAQQQGTILPEQPSADDHRSIEKILLEDRVTKETKDWLDAARLRAEIAPLTQYARPFAH